MILSRRLSLAAVVLAAALFSMGPAFAQQPAPASSSDGSFMTAQTASSQNLPAAEQEDETAVYKKSPTVRAIGKALHLSPEAASSAFEYFNFVILAGGVLFFVIKLVPKAFRDRQSKIDEQLVEARTATEDANQRLKQVEERLGRLDHEIEELRKRAEQDGVGDEQRVKQSIEDERRKIVASAEQEIAAASATAERGLRKFAAELAMARAIGHLQVSETQDRELVHDFAVGLNGGELQERRN